MNRQRSAGFTLIELMIAIILAGIVLGSIYKTLQNNQRFYRSESQVLDVQQGVRAVAQLLPSELREVDAVAGDILAMGPDSITIRALRNTYFICATPIPASGTIITRNSQVYGYRAVDPTRDRALVFRDGNTQIMSDDTWQDYAISGVLTGAHGSPCTDGTGAGTTMTLTGPISKLDSVTLGSPVRTYEQLTYRLYVDSSGVGWLGVRAYISGSWGSVSPVAGPLNGTGGIALTYYDSTGAVTAVPTSVAQIMLQVRGLSETPIMIQGRRANLQKYQDSLTVRVALRNNS
jgi:prepilin-type N-terminal cleavage/methylation domain-containing protein